MKNKFVNSKMCKSCGGACCKSIPGICMPEDFFPKETMFESLVEALASGMYQIDCYDYCDETDSYFEDYYILPSIVGALGNVYVKSWGGRCVFLNDYIGCLFPFEKRPFACRTLIPKKTITGKCSNPILHKKEKEINAKYGKQVFSEAWKPYVHILKKAADFVIAQKEKKECG